MLAVNQTRFSENGERGNCLAACIASLLNIDLATVPAFEELPPGQWRESLSGFVDKYGYTLHQMSCPPDDTSLYIRIGRSPRGRNHAVIARGEEVVFDPHPSRAGLTSFREALCLDPH